MFTREVCEQLRFYVYRLIDPRNGETFYVGKGTGNRIFEHAKGEPLGGDDVSDKLRRIREIRVAGFEVAHVIHRHGMDEGTALEVEAALLDAYPGVTNLAGGHGSGERGVMHANEIIEKFSASAAEFAHPMVAITINRSAEEKPIYEAVRYAWKLDRCRAERAQFVLAVQNGLIVGVFKPSRWMDATPQNFPGTIAPRDGRTGFVGEEAPDVIKQLYLRKRMPDELRRRGAANPVRYIAIK